MILPNLKLRFIGRRYVSLETILYQVNCLIQIRKNFLQVKFQSRDTF